MDQKYFGLVELIAFTVVAFAFLGYQIWSVRKKRPEDSVSPTGDRNPRSDAPMHEK